MVRVAALQFVSGTNIEDNLARCLRLIEEAVQRNAAQLVVLPAFINHPPVYEDAEQARRVAVTLDGPFVGALADAARRHAIHLAAHVSLLRDGQRLTASALLFGPAGELLCTRDASSLPEPLAALFSLTPAGAFEHVETSLGRLASCWGGEHPLVPRALALHGAELLCVHWPADAPGRAQHEAVVRAAESGVQVVAASPTLPDALEREVGSVIVSARGEIVASAPAAVETLVGATLELPAASGEPEPRFAARRPDVYRALGARGRRGDARRAAPSRLEVIVVPGPCAEEPEAAIEQAAQLLSSLARKPAPLVVLPELFCFAEACVDDAARAAALFLPAVRRLSEACAGSGLQVVTSLVERSGDAYFHMGLLLGQAGVIARQPQLHVPARHAWATPGRRVETVQLAWGKLALVVGEDALSPEQLGLCALLGARLVARPFARAAPWELEHAPRAFALAYGVSSAAAGHGPEQHALVDADDPTQTAVRDERCGRTLLSLALSARSRVGGLAQHELERGLLDSLTSRRFTSAPPSGESEASASP